MSRSLESRGPRVVMRVAAASLAASLLAGCSSDAARLNDAFSNPFSTTKTDPTPTGSTAKQVAAKTAAAHVSPVARPSTLTAPATTASISMPVSQPNLGSAAGWSAEGGTPIVAATGESADMLSTRYGVPVPALLKVNGFKSAQQIQPGTRLIIPVYNAASVSASTPTKSAQSSKPTPTAAAVKAPVKPVAVTKPGVIPGAVAAPAVARLTPPKPPTVAKIETPAVKIAEAKPEKAAPVQAIDPAPTASLPQAEEKPVAAGNSPEFRWPARGRIIQGFKAGAGGNDGINIAVPEGTSVKAAEGGVVAYAGSELKGYGNLVLIRHPNGFVSAYANNGELAVKRGDQVKRGQTVAKSGQSGNVNSPQLHFELRKGSVPVDPTNFLAGL